MELIKIDGTEYLAGIQWSALVSHSAVNKRFNELVDESNENRNPAKFGFIARHNNNAVVGLVEGLKKPKQKSAAIHLANANALEYKGHIGESLSWICVQKVQGGKYWIGAVVNGLPYGQDVVVEQYDVYSKINDFISDAKILYEQGEDKVETIVYYDDESLVLDKLKNIENVSLVEKDFLNIVAGVKYKAVIKQKTSKGSMIATVLGVVVLGAVAYGGYLYYEQMEEEEEAARLAEEQNASDAELLKRQAEYEKAKEEALRKAKEEAINAMNARLTSPSMANILSSWNETLGTGDLVIQGWHKKEINCGLTSAKNKTFCDYTLERSKAGNVGTVKDIKDYYADRALSDLTVEDSGDIAIAKRVNDNEFEVEKGDYTTLADFDFEAFKYKNLSELQLLALNGLEKTISKPLLITTKVVLPPPPQGIKQSLDFEELNLGIAEGSVSIKGKELYKLQSLMDRLKSLEKPFYLKSINIKSTENTSSYQWELKGSFFVEDKDHKGGNLDKIQIPKSEIIKNKGK